MTFDHDRTVAIQRANLATEVLMIAGAAPGSSLYDGGGILAAVVPSAPEQTIVNMATFDTVAGLIAGLDGMTDAYRSAGVRKWSIWVPGWETDAMAALTTRGYRNTLRLPAILLDLATFEPCDLSDLEHDADADMATVGRINEAAHDGGAGLAAALQNMPPGLDLRPYRARLDGEAAAVVCAIDNPGVDGAADCGVYFGATHPDAAGKRLGRKLLTAALLDARERGCATASGQASLVGAPIWTALGFDTAFMFDTFTWTEADRV
ncbi:GNAT family N-acetyltransferase [Streptomyces sp. 5K101]|uniref:GNAT family N-acetyltransferase n=1 Tax=Streptomyces sp. 5K101 TaxID=3390037 RepID=UPI00397579B4